mgnify:CR=1 FL=1
MQIRFVLKALLLGSALALILSNAVEIQQPSRDTWQLEAEPAMTQRSVQEGSEMRRQDAPLPRVVIPEWRAH